ncbi:hypothetical protein DCAR_0207514 [Daucus carota subsp. sativus]|uniref:Uncharacterized protein n=1 Tax=Daucus carota subsp. sativus TaxID=79200 RepID=A0A161X4E6_DAUCS|nr:PREDICTED: uncharacterized protein LOC108209552 [Daucus carota subsp. sativus]WOG88279.1 hypothetical protein DCAR_0207514 [Daucus carota subsp. sativus]
MSLRPRQLLASPSTNVDDNAKEIPAQPLPQRAISQSLTSMAHLANLLPTGTVLAFQLLVPVFTNKSSCDSTTRPATFFLLVFLAASCILATFTDSFRSAEGRVFYGFATFKGMWLFDYPAAQRSGTPDLRKYRLRSIDWIHAMLSVLVFVAVAFKDKNVLNCFYPVPGHGTQEVLNIVPVGIGVICSMLFVVFPTSRHGIGYPVST